MFYEVTFTSLAYGSSKNIIEPITSNAYVNSGLSIDYETFRNYDLSDFIIEFNDELVYAYSKNPFSLYVLGEISTIYGIKKPPLFGEAALI